MGASAQRQRESGGKSEAELKAKAEAREKKKAEKKAAREKAKAEKVPRKPIRGEDSPLLEGTDFAYDPKTQLPPKKSDFKNEADFYEWKAVQADNAAKKYRQQANEARTMGSSAERAKLKRAKKLMAEFTELKKSITDDAPEGFDWDEFEAGLLADQEK